MVYSGATITLKLSLLYNIAILVLP